MTIKDYYRKLSHISLTYSLVLSIIALLIAIGLIYMDKPFLLLTIPMVIISIFYFYIHIVYWYKSMKSDITNIENNEYLQTLLLNKLNDKLECFTPSGKVQYSIAGRFENSQLFSIHIKNVGQWKEEMYYIDLRTFIIYNGETKKIGELLLQNKSERKFKATLIYFSSNYELMKENGTLKVFKRGGPSYQMASLEKGFMPLSWNQRFAPNTPIITFHEKTNLEEREMVLIVYYFFQQLKDYVKIQKVSF